MSLNPYLFGRIRPRISFWINNLCYADFCLWFHSHQGIKVEFFFSFIVFWSICVVLSLYFVVFVLDNLSIMHICLILFSRYTLHFIQSIVVFGRRAWFWTKFSTMLSLARAPISLAFQLIGSIQFKICIKVY